MKRSLFLPLLPLLSSNRGRGIRIIRIQRIHILLLGVQVVIREEEDDTRAERRARNTSEHPQDGRVICSRGEGFGDSRAECVGKEIHGLNEGFHGWRSLGVGVFETGDGGEDFRETDEDIGGSLDGDMDVVALTCAIDDGGVAARVFVAGTGGVDEVLDDGSVHHGERGDDESQ